MSFCCYRLKVAPEGEALTEVVSPRHCDGSKLKQGSSERYSLRTARLCNFHNLAEVLSRTDHKARFPRLETGLSMMMAHLRQLDQGRADYNAQP